MPSSIHARPLPAATSDTRPIATQLGDFIHATQYDDLPADTVAQAKSRLLDALGTALAARQLPVPSLARKFVAANRGGATLIGENHRAPAIDAAFVNATLVNGCTHDDFLEKSHPGAVTVPAALAVAEEESKNGRELLTSIVLGYELVARAYLGGPTMLPKFRGSGVAGAFGAAAAAGKLLGLSSVELAHALGCSAMFASGFGEGFRSGTMDVKLNVGWACRSGVSAAQLARFGATAAPLVFEGESGFFRAFAGTAELADAAVRGLGERFLIDDVVYKERPVCIFVQTPVHLALNLMQQHKLDPAAIERVSIRAPLPTLTNPGYQNVAPYESPLKARISVRFTVAAALLGKPVDAYAFYEQTRAPDVLALADKIELLEPEAGQDGRVDITAICNGVAYRMSGLEMDSLRPTTQKIVAKFRRLTTDLPPTTVEHILQTVLALEDVRDIRELTSLLQAP
jgi:2-methylcitrate dehydratase PrpD